MNDYLQSIIDRDPAAKSKLSLILTFSANDENAVNKEINPATSVDLIILILSPFKFKNKV